MNVSKEIKPVNLKEVDFIYLTTKMIQDLRVFPFESIGFSCRNQKMFILKVLETENENGLVHTDIYNEFKDPCSLEITKLDDFPLEEVEFIPINKDYFKFIKKHLGKSFFGPSNPAVFENSLKRKLMGTKVTENCFIPIKFLGEKHIFQIKAKSRGKIEEGTKIILNLNINKDEIRRTKLGGVEKQRKELQTLLDKVFKEKSKLPLKSSLIYGPSGTGKSTLAEEIAQEYEDMGIHVLIFEDSRDMNRFLSMEDDLKCIIIIDNVESQDLKLVHKILDKVVEQDTFVIGISSDIVELRFDKKIHFAMPNTEEREEILKIYLGDFEWNEKIVSFTPGFVGKDLKRLSGLIKDLKKDKIIWKDIESCLLMIRPINLTDFGTKVEAVPWEDIGGYEKVKKDLVQSLYWPQTESFKKLNLPASSGILLYGPSGCGKTLLCRGLASFGKMSYVQIRGPELFSKYYGETEKTIRDIFARARELEPCVLLIDEIDSIGTSRSLSDSDSGVSNRALTQILTEMDGIEEKKQVFVIGCTTDKDSLDSALIRPGRLDRHIYVGLPNENDRLEILKVLAKKMVDLRDLNLEELAKKSEGYTCSKILEMANEYAMIKLREEIEKEEIVDEMNKLSLE